MVNPHLLGKLVQHGPAYDLRPHFGQKSFISGWKGFEKEIGCYGIQDGIAKKFKAFVVDPDPVIGFVGQRPV
jgi:hypothetical protein